MNSRSSPTPRNSVEVLGSPQDERERALASGYWLAMLVMAIALVVLWFAVDEGPDHPAYPMMVTAWVFALTPGVAIPAVSFVTRILPRSRFRVPAGERVLHRMLGVGVFARILATSGYNRRIVRPLRRFDGTRAGLPALESSALGGIIAHGACFAIHSLVAALALFTDHARGAMWILLPGVVLHLYPVLLQRSIVLRLQPLMSESAARDFGYWKR